MAQIKENNTNACLQNNRKPSKIIPENRENILHRILNAQFK